MTAELLASEWLNFGMNALGRAVEFLILFVVFRIARQNIAIRREIGALGVRREHEDQQVTNLGSLARDAADKLDHITVLTNSNLSQVQEALTTAEQRIAKLEGMLADRMKDEAR